MILSSLGRKVLDQTNIPEENFDWYWWIERRLQTLRINALVQMINNSKKIDMDYIDGYVNKYKWGIRPAEEQLYIADHVWLFDMIQYTGVDFPWNVWAEFIKISPNHYDIVDKSIRAMFATPVRGHQYWLAIYKTEITNMYNTNMEISQALDKSKMSERNDKREITNHTYDKWKELKNII